MAAATNIIAALGIDTTLFIQFGVFMVVFFFLKHAVFAPYFNAYERRQHSTKGSQEQAEKVYAQTRELETLYQRKARSLNADVKAIFDQARQEGTAEQERTVASARERARSVVDKAREQIQGEANRARESLIKEAPAIGQAIMERLLSRETRQ